MAYAARTLTPKEVHEGPYHVYEVVQFYDDQNGQFVYWDVLMRPCSDRCGCEKDSDADWSECMKMYQEFVARKGQPVPEETEARWRALLSNIAVIDKVNCKCYMVFQGPCLPEGVEHVEAEDQEE